MAGLDVGERPGSINSRLENLRNLAPAERLRRVADATSLGDAERAAFGAGTLPIELANGMIENVIGTFELPVGIATNFTVNGRDYLIPMAIEEPSVVAAASYMARIVRKCGGFRDLKHRADHARPGAGARRGRRARRSRTTCSASARRSSRRPTARTRS